MYYWFACVSHQTYDMSSWIFSLLLRQEVSMVFADLCPSALLEVYHFTQWDPESIASTRPSDWHRPWICFQVQALWASNSNLQRSTSLCAKQWKYKSFKIYVFLSWKTSHETDLIRIEKWIKSCNWSNQLPISGWIHCMLQVHGISSKHVSFISIIQMS